MRTLYRHALLFLLLSISALPAVGTHIVGGDLNLYHLTGDRYKLRLNLFYDLYRGLPGALGDSAQVAIFRSRDNALVTTEYLWVVRQDTISFTNPACSNRVDSLQTSIVIYEKELRLADSAYDDPAGYYAVWDRCCRNSSLSNIESSSLMGQLFYLEFPATTYNGAPFRNNSPAQFSLLSDYACVGRPFQFGFGGVDADNDSLVYRLSDPWVGFSTFSQAADTFIYRPKPYPKVEWKPGFSTQLQIPGTPPLSIDARRGTLRMTPTRPGLFVFAVECREYRQGRYLGMVRRDYQILVLDCEPNTVPQIAFRNTMGQPAQDGDTVSVSFENGPACFELAIQDSIPDTLNITLLAPDLGSFATVTQTSGFTSSDIGKFTTTLCVDPCAGSQGFTSVPVYLRVADNACSLPNVTELTLHFKLASPYEAVRLPNILTPNDDGRNDKLHLPTLSGSLPCLPAFGGIEIYNRIGKAVFRSSSPDFSWPERGVEPGIYFVNYTLSGKRRSHWVEVAN